MGKVDSVHGRAIADGFIQEMDFAIRKSICESLDQIQFGSYCPFAARGRIFYGLNNHLSAANNIGI
jgi:hypothetical protein